MNFFFFSLSVEKKQASLLSVDGIKMARSGKIGQVLFRASKHSSFRYMSEGLEKCLKNIK